jgi:arylsulfatase A-like enzyme
LAEELHPTAWIVAQARRIVAETAGTEPLFLTASFYAPHPPLFPPPKYFQAVLARKLPQPARGDWVDWNSVPRLDKVKPQSHRVLLEGETLRAAQAGYFGLIEHLDDQLAPLIADFQARSVKAGRPWLIVFSTDHGELLGDHGFFRKCEPYEGSANIPFLITGSSALGFRTGLRCLQPVCLEDIMPTLLELTGATRPAVLDGVSLASVLRGEERVLRPWLHFEHAPCYSQEQAFHALTDGRFKYIWRPSDGTEQLFDLDQDPREEHNLCGDQTRRATLERWRATLVERLAKRPEGFSDGRQLRAGRPYPPLQAR